MKIRLVTVSRGRTPWADECAADYGRRIDRYTSFEEVRLKPERNEDQAAAKSAEGRRLLKLVGDGDWLVAFDERGKSLSSEAWAQLIEEASRASVRNMFFAIGGPYGHPPEVRKAAKRCVALAPMVLNHQVARVVALEQIYRAWTILRREPYHHAG